MGTFKPALVVATAALLLVCVASCGGGGDSSSTAVSEAQAQTGSRSFVVPGGDNSVQGFGSEANDRERKAASSVLLRYLRARKAGRSAQECALLARSVRKTLEAQASCPAAVAQLLSGGPSAKTFAAGVGSLRIEGDRGFALLHGSDGVDYAVPMTREGGEWKVALLVPYELG